MSTSSNRSRESRADVDDHEKMIAALSYIWIVCLYGLLMHKKSKFIQFHAKQGLALFVFEIVSPFLLFLAPLVIIVCVIFSIWGFVMAMEGVYWTMPWIGPWIKKSKV